MKFYKLSAEHGIFVCLHRIASRKYCFLLLAGLLVSKLLIFPTDGPLSRPEVASKFPVFKGSCHVFLDRVALLMESLLGWRQFVP